MSVSKLNAWTFTKQQTSFNANRSPVTDPERSRPLVDFSGCDLFFENLSELLVGQEDGPSPCTTCANHKSFLEQSEGENESETRYAWKCTRKRRFCELLKLAVKSRCNTIIKAHICFCACYFPYQIAIFQMTADRLEEMWQDSGPTFEIPRSPRRGATFLRRRRHCRFICQFVYLFARPLACILTIT